MSSNCQPSCPSAPRQWQRHHAIQAEATCTTPSNGRRYLKRLPFQRMRIQQRSGRFKAVVRDDILVEQLKHIGPKAHKWLLTMLNIYFMENKIPTIWRQSKIVAILKPGKDSSISKNYRPTSLLCHTYKLYERMILTRIAPAIEQHLIKEQTGFRSINPRWNEEFHIRRRPVHHSPVPSRS